MDLAAAHTWIRTTVVRRRGWSTLLVCLALAVALRVGQAGSRANERVFYDAAMALRGLLAPPPLAAGLRVIAVDDRTVQLLGRTPSLVEWNEIASLLRPRCAARFLLHGVFNLLEGSAPTADGAGTPVLYTAVAAASVRANARAIRATSFPARLFLAGPRSSGDDRGPSIIGPHRSFLPFVAGFGTVGIDENEQSTLITPLSGGRVAPNLALRAARSLEVVDGRLVVDGRPVPESRDGRFRIDTLDMTTLLPRTVAAHAFFVNGKVASFVSGDVAKWVEGATTILMIPDAQTGTSFVSTPRGQVPGFLAFASLVNGVLRGHYVYQPTGTGRWCLLLPVLLALVAARLRPALALATHAGLTLFVYGGSTWALWTQGCVLPCLQLIAITAGAAAVAAGSIWSAALRERAQTSADLALGSTVQSYFLPRCLRGSFGPWEFLVKFEPHGPMSGDWVKINVCEDARSPFAIIGIGDVAGKGPAAALVTAVIATIWDDEVKRWGREAPDPRRLIRRLDEAIVASMDGNQYSTLALLLLTDEGAFVTSAGMSRWRSMERGQAPTRVDTVAANPLGIRSMQTDVSFAKFAPTADRLLVAFTDGVMESERAEKRFTSRIAACPMQADIGSAATYLYEQAVDVGKSFVVPDDRTMVMAKCTARAPLPG